jgi:hypothetical protein
MPWLPLAPATRRTQIVSRVARFFLVQHTKTGKIYKNDHKIHQMAITYTKWPYVTYTKWP